MTSGEVAWKSEYFFFFFFSLRRALRKLIERLLVESKLRELKSDYNLTAGGKNIHKKNPIKTKHVRDWETKSRTEHT